MRHRMLVAIGVVLVVVACHNPTSPPPPQQTPAAPTAKALTINGRARIAPGETEAFEAIATMSDGTTQVYTTKVQWQTSNGNSLSINPTTGVATARGVGDVFVYASYFSIRSTSVVLVIPTGTYRLTGKVLESGLPVVNAQVKIASGQGAGLTVATDVNGDYRLYGVAGSVQLQVTKSGYTTLTRSLDVSRDDTLDITDFKQTAAIPSLAGTYTLAITVASDCRLFPTNSQFPADARARTYGAVVTQDGARLHVALSGADFLIQSGHGNAFDGRIDPSGVTFMLDQGTYAYFYYYYTIDTLDLVEKISPTDYLGLFGRATVTSSPAGLTGVFSGLAMVFDKPAPTSSHLRMTCQSSRHQFSLTPQAAATRIRR